MEAKTAIIGEGIVDCSVAEHTPYETVPGLAVKLDKGRFVGREALMNRFPEGLCHRFTPLTIDEGEAVMGSEPVWSGDCAVGCVTSAAYIYSVEKSIAYAWLPPELAEPGTSLEVEYFGERHPATVAKDPMFDPSIKRMRGPSSPSPRPLTRVGKWVYIRERRYIGENVI